MTLVLKPKLIYFTLFIYLQRQRTLEMKLAVVSV